MPLDTKHNETDYTHALYARIADTFQTSDQELIELLAIAQTAQEKDAWEPDAHAFFMQHYPQRQANLAELFAKAATVKQFNPESIDLQEQYNGLLAGELESRAYRSEGDPELFDACHAIARVLLGKDLFTQAELAAIHNQHEPLLTLFPQEQFPGFADVLESQILHSQARHAVSAEEYAAFPVAGHEVEAREVHGQPEVMVRSIDARGRANETILQGASGPAL